MEPTAEINVAILGAVRQEVSALAELLEACRIFPFRSQTIWLGKYSSLSVLLGTTGLGKVNAAITTASLLERFPVAQAWNVGCAGAYPEGPLEVGDVLITNKTLCGDEGVMTREGPLPVSEIEIPILVQNGSEFYDHLPPNWAGNLGAIIKETPPGIYRHERGHPLARAYLWGTADRFDLQRPGPRKGATSQPKPPSHYLMKDGETDQDLFRLFHGPTLTVSMASGDLGVANERFRRYGAYAENMEGSAVVQACFRFQVPVVECRGVSNIAGVRPKETWQLQKSIAHCHGIVLNWLETLNSFKLLK